MAGIYIKDMAMPTGNHEITVRIQSNGRVLDQWGHRFNQEFIAVPVPDHGRLGDLDALADKCDAPYWCVWLSDIEDAPTVIPTDKEAHS